MVLLRIQSPFQRKVYTNMRQTDFSLLEQMRISDYDIDYRKVILNFTEEDCKILKEFKAKLETSIDDLVSRFYESQTSVPEIALVIGDADTLRRLRGAQRRYVLDLFSGLYDLEYVNNRLRIGLVHKRMGVEPKLYLSAIHTLKHLMTETIINIEPDEVYRLAVLTALEKLLWFDITLVFETYIRSLVSEIEISKSKSERYAEELEVKVKERTLQLEELSRTDMLTGLQTVRYLRDTLTLAIRSAQRRSEPVSVVYIDINDFKKINDTFGHQRGDEILQGLGRAIRKVSRIEDSCFRYGGDEFCLVLPNCLKSDANDIYINRLTAEMNKQFPDVTISVGIAQTGPEEFDEPEYLISMADQQMYTMKKDKHSSDQNEMH